MKDLEFKTIKTSYYSNILENRGWFNLYYTLIIGERQYWFLNIQWNEQHKWSVLHRDVLCVIGDRKLKFGSEMDGLLEVCNAELG